MTTKPASSRWIAIFSSIVLLLLCFLAAETWRSTFIARVPVQPHAEPRGQYVGVATKIVDGQPIVVTKEECIDPGDWVIDEFSEQDIASIQASIAPAVADRIEIKGTLRDAPIRPFGYNRTLSSRRSLRKAERDQPLPQVPSQARTVDRSLAPPSAEKLLRRWPYPQLLVDDIRLLLDDELTTAWAQQTLELINRLYTCDDRDQRLSYYLAELQRQVDAAVTLVTPEQSLETWSSVTRVHYGLHRRVELWRLIQEVNTGDFVWVNGDEGKLHRSLDNVDALLASSGNGAGWSAYLELSKLRSQWVGESVDAELRRSTARRVLERLKAETLTSLQKSFLQRPIFESLARQLAAWAGDPIDYQQLLTTAEEYETDPNPHAGRKLANAIESLQWANNDVAQKLGQHLDIYYRNANARVSVSAELLHELLPNQGKEKRTVSDQILGTRVTGSSVNQHDLFIQLVPDHSQIKLGLVARGMIDSRTYSDVGPVRLHNNGHTKYEATQFLILDRAGFRLPQPHANADGNSRLTDVETDFDVVPLIGSLVRSFATQQHEESRATAKSEMEAKIARRAACELHQTVKEKLSLAEAKLSRTVLLPLRNLELDPVAMDLQTTDRRVVARYRLAGVDQLAAHTPRPLAPSDSWLSVQLHESSLNNALGRLKLGGQHLSIRDLFAKIVNATTLPLELDANLPNDVFIQFAEVNPILIRLDESRVHLQMRIVELENRNNLWTDFVVSTTYAPSTEGGFPSLKRDTLIDLDGDFGTFQRIPLRAIFNAVFPKNKSIPLVGPQIRTGPHFAATHVSQFIVIDGWMGIAISGGNLPRQADGNGLGRLIR